MLECLLSNMPLGFKVVTVGISALSDQLEQMPLTLVSTSKRTALLGHWLLRTCRLLNSPLGDLALRGRCAGDIADFLVCFRHESGETPRGYEILWSEA